MKHRAFLVGAGRIGAGWNWHDDAYTHAGAYRALSDRVELIGCYDPDDRRAWTAGQKWNIPYFASLDAALSYKPDIVSVCTQPEQQPEVIDRLRVLACVKGIWCEKPWVSNRIPSVPTQVNYIRRADPQHRYLAEVHHLITRLIVYGKDDIHTRCHFEDLAKWWKCELDYRVFGGPCAYVITGAGTRFFDNGGVDGAACMKGMLSNLLDHIDNPDVQLWSPAP